MYVQADGAYRTKAEDIGQFYVQNDRGDPVAPVGGDDRRNANGAPNSPCAINLYRSAQINAMAKPGYSSAQAMKALEETFAESMPREMGFDYLGMSFQEQKAQKGLPAAGDLFVFPAVRLPHPCRPVRKLVSAHQRSARHACRRIWRLYGDLDARAGEQRLRSDRSDRAYRSGGEETLSSLSSLPRDGMNRAGRAKDAALEGAQLRLRPILMTSFAFLFGDPTPGHLDGFGGPFARQIMGTTVMGGAAAASLIAIFLIPVTFYVVVRMTERRRHKKLQESEVRDDV